MLRLEGIAKKYKTGDFIQTALDGIDLTLRDNEFVAVLGPSGSGKTTLLNIIGGLDRYESGNLLINGVSTKDYRDRDWDTYRNHTIGFVFQSYNLIPHQSVLDNVALALTIGGISGRERKERALKALEQVGLSDHIHKKPNQLSGGQMQRVAIARALVNNPDIVLADEPTGALDTDTGIQVMELLKEVAKDRLVVMVTHNPDLANEYATRIINIKDGKIIKDSDPVTEDEIKKIENEKENTSGKTKRSGMSFGTSFKLSLNNLRTKMGRAVLTSIAGSIGIIGIALILAMSNGVNNYIYDIQRDTMSSYPLTIESQELDLSSVLNSDSSADTSSGGADTNEGGLYADVSDVSIGMAGASYSKNNLEAFKKYLDSPDSEINRYIGKNGVTYGYTPAFTVFTKDSEDSYVDTNDDPQDSTTSAVRSMFAGMTFNRKNTNETATNFSELTPGKGDALISDLVLDNYNIVAGDWPKEYNEIVIKIGENNSLNAVALYQLGIITYSEYQDMVKDESGDSIRKISDNLDDLLNKEFYLVPQSMFYVKGDNGIYTEKPADLMNIDGYVDESIKLKVSGIVKPSEDLSNEQISTIVAYTSKLTDKIVEETDKSQIVKDQEKNPETNVLTGVSFEAKTDEDKAKDAREYASNLSVTDKAAMYQVIMMYYQQQKAESDSEEEKRVTPEMAAGAQPGAGEAQLAAALDSWLASGPETKDLVKLYDNYIGDSSYDDNMLAFGKVNKDKPSVINIYTDTFEDKDGVTQSIQNYNDSVSEEDKITYTDIIGLMTSSMTKIVNVITAVLIGFVSVSLVVSSIMIGIITHISVLERTKEIGILRAMGASKSNISQVFNAETIIIGLASGLIGVGVAVLITLPMTEIMRHSMEGAENVRAYLSPVNALILIGLSMLVTFIGGIIPAKRAAGKDPVTALRSE